MTKIESGMNEVFKSSEILPPAPDEEKVAFSFAQIAKGTRLRKRSESLCSIDMEQADEENNIVSSESDAVHTELEFSAKGPIIIEQEQKENSSTQRVELNTLPESKTIQTDLVVKEKDSIVIEQGTVVTPELVPHDTLDNESHSLELL